MTSQVKPGSGLAALILVAVNPPCSADSGDLACKLERFLPVLYVIAVVLGISLLVVIGIAVHAWRKNKEAEIIRR